MKKSIVFDTARKGAQVEIEYASYGFDVFLKASGQKRCICCIGDSRMGCIFARKTGKNTANVTYCHPVKVPAELSYPSVKWANIAHEFHMSQKTPNGRILIAKPIVDKDKINGVRILCAEDEAHEAKHMLEMKVTDKCNEKSFLSTAIKAVIIDPD